MPIVTSYVNGSTAGTPPGKNDHQRAKRSEVVGWSSGAVRRHTKWLYGVDAETMAGDGLTGYALTLTLRDCPPNSVEFHRLRRLWVRRLERLGLRRLHWVIEWQRRGVPHIHAAVYFDAENLELAPGFSVNAGTVALSEWVTVAADYGATLAGQHSDTIAGALGWLKYLSKHASRGVKHYQRQGHPEGWTKTGRLWGYGGEWPLIEPSKHHMAMPAYHRYRRLIRAWRIADARAAGDPKRIAYARRMLACNDRNLSNVRGISDWTPEDVTLRLIDLLQRDGFAVWELNEKPEGDE